MRKLVLLIIALISFSAHSQTNIPPLGCNEYAVLDSDNNGYAEFDIYWMLNVLVPAQMAAIGIDLSGYSLGLFPSEYDFNYNTNEIVSNIYINAIQHQQYTYVKFTFTGNGPAQPLIDQNPAWFSCYVLEAYAPNGDADNDGIINADEDLNGNGNLTDDDSDNDGNPNLHDTDAPLSTIAVRTDAFSILPNPATSSINITFNQKPVGNFEITVYDMAGKLKIQKSNATAINTSTLKAGTYLVKASTANGTFSQKLIVK